jgi:hypothetical protein
MQLAQQAGIKVAETRVVKVLKKRVILFRRFDCTATPEGVQHHAAFESGRLRRSSRLFKLS